MSNAFADVDEWQRLDSRMLLVYPVKELLRFLPVLFGVFVAGTAAGGPGWWLQLLGLAPIVLGVLRYVTTSFRIADGRVELRRGLLNRHQLATPLDRVRTVDLTASPIHRLLGLTTVRIGTGTASTDDEDQLDLDGVPRDRARRLRTDLLRVSVHADPGHQDPERSADAVPDRVVVRLDLAWVRLAPLTSSGLVIAAAVLGLASQVVNSIGGFGVVHPGRVLDDASGWTWWAAVPVGLVVLALVVSLLAIGGYLITNWGFTLTHHTATTSTSSGAWHLSRGLLTTRETTLDESRVRGVSVSEPIGLRLAGGGRTSAIVTGLDRDESGNSLLVPPAPIGVVTGVAAEVLGTGAPLLAPLVGHGPRARTRRYTRALVPTLLLVAGAGVLVGLDLLPARVLAVGLPLALVTAALGRDRAASLGHALVGRHLVARSGSLERRRDVLDADAVIGWNLRDTWFQRRAGLTTLTATTAGGRQSVTVLDVPEGVAVALATAALPELTTPFLDDCVSPS